VKKLMLVVSGMIVLGGASAQACSCAGPGSPKAELAQHNSVLQGTVESIKQVAVGAHGSRQNLVKFKIEQSWKGISSWHSTMVVRTSTSGASCGYGFKVGQSYVVYAGLSEEGELHTSLCTRNALTANAAEDLAELGEGVKPQN